MRVGLCEDDASVRRVLLDALTAESHNVVMTRTGAEALRMLGPESSVDVLVLDIGLPDSDGRDVCQALRSAGQHAPVLFLTALDAVHERVAGFHAGGDDYLGKPFAVSELVVRVQALARRAPARPVDHAHGLRLDPVLHAAIAGGRTVSLTPTEYRMFAALTSRPGEVVRRRAVVSAAWPDGAQVSENTVDSYIRRLRVKLEELDVPVRIETVRGVGFSLR